MEATNVDNSPIFEKLSGNEKVKGTKAISPKNTIGKIIENPSLNCSVVVDRTLLPVLLKLSNVVPGSP